MVTTSAQGKAQKKDNDPFKATENNRCVLYKKPPKPPARAPPAGAPPALAPPARAPPAVRDAGGVDWRFHGRHRLSPNEMNVYFTRISTTGVVLPLEEAVAMSNGIVYHVTKTVSNNVMRMHLKRAKVLDLTRFLG